MTVMERVRQRWLLAANVLVAVFLGLPLLAPVLLASGFDGPANVIYAAYHTVCHQWAFRSFFVFGPEIAYDRTVLGGLLGENAMFTFVGSPELGYKTAFCERDVAIYASVLVAGMVYGWKRDRFTGMGLKGYSLLILPMALDGFSQMFGWHESTAVLRTLTGLLFGAASVLLIYPRVDAIFERDLGPARPRVESVAGTA